MKNFKLTKIAFFAISILIALGAIYSCKKDNEIAKPVSPNILTDDNSTVDQILELGYARGEVTKIEIDGSDFYSIDGMLISADAYNNGGKQLKQHSIFPGSLVSDHDIYIHISNDFNNNPNFKTLVEMALNHVVSEYNGLRSSLNFYVTTNVSRADISFKDINTVTNNVYIYGKYCTAILASRNNCGRYSYLDVDELEDIDNEDDRLTTIKSCLVKCIGHNIGILTAKTWKENNYQIIDNLYAPRMISGTPADPSNSAFNPLKYPRENYLGLSDRYDRVAVQNCYPLILNYDPSDFYEIPVQFSYDQSIGGGSRCSAGSENPLWCKWVNGTVEGYYNHLGNYIYTYYEDYGHEVIKWHVTDPSIDLFNIYIKTIEEGGVVNTHLMASNVNYANGSFDVDMRKNTLFDKGIIPIGCASKTIYSCYWQIADPYHPEVKTTIGERFRIIKGKYLTSCRDRCE